MSNIVTTKLGGEDRSFGFNLNEIEELQRLCGNVGIGTIIERVMENQFYYADIYQTIRLGLIGSGEVSPTRATELVNTYVHGKTLAAPNDPSSPLSVAKVILGSLMFGVAENNSPKKATAEDVTMDGSMSPQYELPLSEPGATQ